MSSLDRPRRDPRYISMIQQRGNLLHWRKNPVSPFSMSDFLAFELDAGCELDHEPCGGHRATTLAIGTSNFLLLAFFFMFLDFFGFLFSIGVAPVGCGDQMSFTFCPFPVVGTIWHLVASIWLPTLGFLWLDLASGEIMAGNLADGGLDWSSSIWVSALVSLWFDMLGWICGCSVCLLHRWWVAGSGRLLLVAACCLQMGLGSLFGPNAMVGLLWVVSFLDLVEFGLFDCWRAEVVG